MHCVIRSFLLVNDRLNGLGLRQHTKANLLLELLIPTALSVIIVIQLHFFHRPFMKMIDFRHPRRRSGESRDARSIDSLSVVADHEDFGANNQKDDDIIRVNHVEDQEHLADENLGCARVENDFPSDEQKWCVKCYDYVTLLLWKLGELHMSKVISFTLICVVLSKVGERNAASLSFLSEKFPSSTEVTFRCNL